MNSSLKFRVCLIVFAAAWLVMPVVVQAGTSNSLMDISTDGRLLACSNRDSGTVTIVELPALKKAFEVTVGRHPEGVTFIGASHQLAVAVYGDDCIRFINADVGTVTASLEVQDEPYGIVSDPAGSHLWVTLDYPGEVICIDPVTRTISKSVVVGKFLRGLAVTSTGTLLITEYLSGIVRSLDAESLAVTNEWVGSAQDNLARQITTHPTRAKAYLPLQRSVTSVFHGAGSIFPYLSIIDTQPGKGAPRKRVQMDSFRGTYVVANPWEVAVSPSGEQLFIIFSGTNDMFVCRVIDDDYTEVEFAKLRRTGWNPRAVKVSPDGQTFFVYNALDFTVEAASTKTFETVRTVQVSHWPGDPEMLLGKRLFFTANPPMTAQRWISCSSCHPDGQPDGRTWHQPEGLRSTQPLFGLKGTHPIHWSADRDEVQDFEHTIRSPLMQGKGLIRGKVFAALEEPNAGRSKELDAIAAYANSLEFSLSPHAKRGLDDSAQRGKDLFFSAEVGCATCHSGAYYTDRQLHDVGTGQDDPSEKIGPNYDTPTLLGIYRSAPYLHHGKAETLLDMLTKFNPHDQHGRTRHLSAGQLDDLVNYLKMLPHEQP